MATGPGWRSSLCHRLAYGIAGALTAIISAEFVLFLYPVFDPGYYGADLQEVRKTKGLSEIIMAGGFLAGVATWYPPGRREPSIDTLRLVGTMVGLTFWIPGLLLPIIVWSEYPSEITSNIGRYALMSIFGCAFGGVIAAFMAGPVAYLVGAIVLAPLRLFERLLSPTMTVGTTSTTRWTAISNTLVAIPAVLAAAIASISTIYYAGILLYAGAIRLPALF